ncbi:MAG: type VI secretion system tip protein TssI/VgrG [Byssovorax sp.]
MAKTLGLTFTCSALEGELTVTSAQVVEAISRPTAATVSLLSKDDIDGEPAIGQPAHLAVSLAGEGSRDFHLVVTAFRFEGLHRDGRRRYAVELMHELWLLTLRTDVRMFQDKDAREIVAAVLDGAGIPGGDVSFSIQRKLQKRTYCVQYRETDFAFVSRLLEHEGVFYVIADDESQTHVTFADATTAFSPIDGEASMRLLDDDMHGEGVHDFVLESRPVPGKVTLGDYNYEKPGADLNVTQPGREGAPGDRFDYAAGFATGAEGQALAKLRIEELLCHQTTGRGGGDRLSFRAGRTFQLEQASRDALSQEYLITRVEHRFVPLALENTVGSSSYENRFTCVPASNPFRPERETPRPRLRGAHVVVATGPSGSEIHTDKLGRMKGKFFWDRVGKDDDTSSCWIRLAQAPIGGSMALARVGWEMSIVYFDGDPDRPIAVSRLYNAEKTSPYGYPAAASRMALQTASSPGGGKSNEIRMEDGAGGMEMFINASKDYDAVTNNNKTEKIGVDEKREVGTDEQLTVGSNQKVTIGGSSTTTVSADEGLRVGADRTKSVGASETVTVGGDIAMTVTGADSETTGGSHMTTALLSISRTSKGSHSLTVGGSMISAAGLGVSLAVAGAKSETVGGAKISASAAGVTESVIGALASTVGGVRVQAAGGNRIGSSKGPSVLTVGGLLNGNAAKQLTIKGSKVGIKVLGVANFLGGGGIVTLTPASASFIGLVTYDASSITFSGNPNLVG